MASSDSDYDYTEDDDDEETDYSDDDDEEEEEEEEGEEDEDDSEYSDDEDEDDDEDGEEEEEDDEEVAREEENAEERGLMSSSDNDDEDEQVPTLEHGQHPEPDEISEGTDAPCSEVSTPVDPISEAEQPSIQTEEPKEILLKGNPIPASSTDLAPASGGVGNLPTSSVTIEMEKVKIDSA